MGISQSLSNSVNLKSSIRLPYDPNEFPRETSRHYISADDKDIADMLNYIGLEDLDDLFSHIPSDIKFVNSPDIPDELNYDSTVEKLFQISKKTKLKTSFIGDTLPHWKKHPIVDFVSKLRPLSTSYTPYQPERSQGTLVTHWIYQCALSSLTGFEAINTSLYDRSAAIYEAITCAIRTNKKGSTVLLAETLFKCDIDVVKTLAEETSINFIMFPINSKTGLLNYDWLNQLTEDDLNSISAFVFPQINSLGLLEDVDKLSNFSASNKIRSIASIDPILLGNGGLKPPTQFGSGGADFIVG